MNKVKDLNIFGVVRTQNKMSQEDVYNFLEKNKGWWSSKQISKYLDIQQSTIALNLNKLIKIILIIRERRNKNNRGLSYEYTLSEYANKQRKEM